MVSATPITGSHVAIESIPARPQRVSQNGRFAIEFLPFPAIARRQNSALSGRREHLPEHFSAIELCSSSGSLSRPMKTAALSTGQRSVVHASCTRKWGSVQPSLLPASFRARRAQNRSAVLPRPCDARYRLIAMSMSNIGGPAGRRRPCARSSAIRLRGRATRRRGPLAPCSSVRRRDAPETPGGE